MVLGQYFLSFVILILGATTAAPISLTYSYSSTKSSSSYFNAYSAFDSSFNSTWSIFWNYQEGSWSDSGCSYTSPVLWDSAVAGGAALFTNNPYYVGYITTQLSKYKNSATGGYSSTTAANTDIYTDDNAQTVWVFLDAYKLSGNDDYLNAAIGIMEFIQGQWYSEGGIRWSYNGEYLASISQTEGALAAVRLYEATGDEQWLSFSKQVINWAIDNLQDPSDHLFYDGLQINTGSINKGKLSYTVGTAISTFSYLYNIEKDENWLEQAELLIQASASGSGALYGSNGYWNNQLKYSYLLFQGLADFYNLVGINSAKGWQLSQNISSEINRQAQYVFDYYQDGTTGNYYDDISSAPPSVSSKYKEAFTTSSSSSSSSSSPGTCNGNYVPSLLTNSAAARIFYEAWRV
ncbi:hypothetical protein CLIB1423_18S03246 [[Candida] railenensis]|uniref:Glycoside hydrolase family 76 protein n=1 Tax=[Candida] railenensis TaxID=45579 RepID=A0A9P0W0P1_9ASCO|nr:hypothetical protein CLIB1423_18S03246 [[Candida] railenensis]